MDQGTWPGTLPLAPIPALLCAVVWRRGAHQGEAPLGVAQRGEYLAGEACLYHQKVVIGTLTCTSYSPSK